MTKKQRKEITLSSGSWEITEDDLVRRVLNRKCRKVSKLHNLSKTTIFKSESMDSFNSIQPYQIPLLIALILFMTTIVLLIVNAILLTDIIAIIMLSGIALMFMATGITGFKLEEENRKAELMWALLSSISIIFLVFLWIYWLYTLAI